MNSFYFWDEMAAKCLKSEHFQEAIQSYKHALESTDDSADQASVWANIGNIYLAIQDISAAVDAFLTASRLDPNSYDLECILERITANGYLNESAMILAKDMYALESVKTGLEGVVDILDEMPAIEKFPAEDDLDAADQAPVDVLVAVAEEPIPVDAAVPAVEMAAVLTETPVESVAVPTPDATSESATVEPVSPEEASQPVAESNETEAAAEIASEPVAQTELADPVASGEVSQPVAESSETEAAAETAPVEPVMQTELPTVAAEATEPAEPVSIEETSQPVAESKETDEAVAPAPVEPVSSEEISQPMADAVPSEVSAEVEVVETAPEPEMLEMAEEIAIPELSAEETNPEIQAVIEAPETSPDTEIPPAVVDVTEPEPATKPEQPEAYIELPIDEILENPLHLRVLMQSEELVESIRQHGILQPLVVTRMADGKYMVVAGNRRLGAARIVGLERVPAVVRSAAERELLELALIENVQRVGLDSLELAEAYQLLVKNFGMSPETIAAITGKSSSVITAAIDLLKLTEEGKQALQEKSISEGHARALVAIDLPALQNNALVYVLENRLGVRQTEDLVRIILNAVAVSRSYDESYQEETLTDAPAQESEPAESTDETDCETPEAEPIVVTEPPQAELVPAAEEVTEPEVAQTVAEESDAQSEPVPTEAVSVSEAETAPDVVEQPVVATVIGDAAIDLLVAESEKAEALLENDTAEKDVEQAASETALEEETIDFFIKPGAEVVNQVQQDGIESPSSADILVEALDETPIPVALPVKSTLAVANCDAARDMAIQAEVAVADAPVLETTFQKVEENLDDVIEEIVQFTAESADETSVNPEPVAQLDCPEPGCQKELEDSDARTQLKGLEAIAVYKRVVENNPGNVRIWHLLGNLYSDMGQYEEAIDCLKRTIELDPGKYTYYYHLGLTLAIAKRYPEAIQALEKTIELAPQHILAHCSLAGCYRRIGNETEAQKHIEIARPELTQEKAYNRACFESISGNTDQAIELLQIALNTDKTPVEWLLRDPDLDFIRDDLRFQAMVAELTLPI